MIQIRLIEKEDLRCSQNHNQPICSINLGRDVSMKERLLCNECMSNYTSNNKILGVNIIQSKIEKNIKKYVEKTTSFLSQKIQLLKILENNLNVWKSTINQTIDSIIGELNLWIQSIISKEQVKDKYNFIKELENFINQSESHEKQFQQMVEQIININKASIHKIQSKLTKLNEQYRNTLKQTNSSLIEIIQISSPKITLTPINNQLKQSNQCLAIAFNSTGQIMISGCDQDIKVWNFYDGQIQEVQTLKSHKKTISCLLFSKNQNRFISGSYDNTIRCWQQGNGQKWSSLQSYEEHSKEVNCLLLCKNENTLFSGSCDKSIKIWMVDFDNNNLKFCYSLIKHSDIVHGLSLNESETVLVSCGEDKQIIIWKKININKWEFQQIVNQSINELGTLICFIKENQFIWVGGIPNGKDCISYFESLNGDFVEQKDKEQQLIVSSDEYNYNLFPIVFNKEKEIILLRHKFHVYLLTKQIHGKYRISTKLKFESNEIWGTMINDAKFLILWEKSQQNYFIYKIDYQAL